MDAKTFAELVRARNAEAIKNSAFEGNVRNAYCDASECGDMETISWLISTLKMKKPAIMMDEGYAFRMACERGYLDLAKYIACAANLSGREMVGLMRNAPIRLAIANGHLEIAQWLASVTDQHNWQFCNRHNNLIEPHPSCAEWFYSWVKTLSLE